MRPNCFYDTFFSSQKALDKYNICAKKSIPSDLTLRSYSDLKNWPSQTTPDKTVETIPCIFKLLRSTPVSPKHKT